MKAIVVKGWCPSLYEPMASGDGLLVRVKPPGAIVTADAARQLGAAVARYGNGVIELTNRAAIQVRGLTEAGRAPFAAVMVAAGLAAPDPNVERRRVVILSPLAGGEIRAIAAAIEATLVRDPRLTALPAKFGVSVDGGGVLPLGDVGADIHVVCTEATCSVMLMDKGYAKTVAAAEVPKVVSHFALVCLDLGARRLPPLRQLAGIGWLPYSNSEHGIFGFGLPFGAITATTLTSLAALAGQWGDGTLRVTPWRAFIVPGVPADAISRLREAGAALGLIIDAADPRQAIFACPGQPACASATVAARADAEQLVKLGLPATVHVSGCAKGCAHPAPARITLVGEVGHYNIVRNGRSTDTPSEQGLTIAEIIAVLRS